ncbi:bifunctional diguanylate cyclase/phosphodiesterase [Lichenicoccus roseus]|uniref:EAL domain-containing protein n=1 Tax=Lichenicoccus roseus TaxID=2683649 RepID=A0A5R9J9Q1_9PROT|nr:EAL domain-containing protein [Lichenicoccus roseus]TLU72086.1 EAL domain-containing protein [Lichenicoccus roseus]
MEHAERPVGDPELSECDREPIHIPGAIQPHGALLAASEDDWRISHASANLSEVLGLDAHAMLGRPLRDAVQELAFGSLAAASGEALSHDNVNLGHLNTLTRADGVLLHLQAHRSGSHVCVNIEPLPLAPEATPAITAVLPALESFRAATSCKEVCTLAVRALRKLTGYDRVMAYRFAAKGDGEIIAELHRPGDEPYLGLHYPAADIPVQARRLIMLQRVGMIADTSYRPVALLVDPSLSDVAPLDLTYSALRSVSPLHCEYLRNMHVGACLTVALVHHDRLWGMLVCQHATPRTSGPELRAVVDMIGKVVSLLLASLGEAEAHADRLQRQELLNSLGARMESRMPLLQALAEPGADLLRCMAASGAVVRMSGRTMCVGMVPEADVAELMLSTMLNRAAGEVLAYDDLGLRQADFPAGTADTAGALLLPLGQASGDAILWLRPEMLHTVVWAGEPGRHAITDTETGRLSPRGSFAAWKEIVRNRSRCWSDGDLATARQLGAVVAAAAARRTEAELALLRYYDPLTRLANRSLLQQRLDVPDREGRPATALVFLDLDRFKAVNDTLGHDAGDTLLIEVAARLLAISGPVHLVTRLGGDEFVVLCYGLRQEAVVHLVEQMRQAIMTPFEIMGRSCHISASIGIVLAKQAGGLNLVRAADMAMYSAKQAGGNRGVMYESALFDKAAQQFAIEADMRDALREGDQFVLLYQPLFRLGAGRSVLAGFEALLRWRHPVRGWLSPALFIPVAEESELILPLGEWVMEQALRQGRAFHAASPGAGLVMNVNVSALQLTQAGFCSGLAGVIEAEGLDAGQLCLEITESMLTGAGASTVLAEARELGVQVAIDDFGIGYSSLSYLRRLPVDVVKLDRSFLEDVGGGSSGEAFVVAVIALAHAAGKPVVFEGIETQDQKDIARRAGADMVQGFFFAPPLSANAALELVRSDRKLSELAEAITSD